MEFRDLHAQYEVLRNEIDIAIRDVLASGRYIGGEPVVQIENRLADYVGVKHCITCGNGTDALQLSLMAWGIGAGDAVFVPDFTFFSSGEVVSAVGATPVFVDVDKRTFNIDPESLEKNIKQVIETTNLEPKVAVAVDLFGQPAEYPKIKTICDKYNLLILEDGAQGFGGRIEERMACSFGHISTTSFFPAKPLGCYGDGGAIFTNDEEWASRIRSLAIHGKGLGKYDNVRIGMNSRLDTLQAAVLLVKLSAFKDFEIEAVNFRASEYNKALKDTGLILPAVLDGYTSSWAQYSVQLPETTDRSDLQNELKKNGIPSMVYYPKPMHEQEAFLSDSICFDGCPNAKKLTNSVLSLPMGPYLENKQIETIANIVKTFLV